MCISTAAAQKLPVQMLLLLEMPLRSCAEETPENKATEKWSQPHAQSAALLMFAANLPKRTILGTVRCLCAAGQAESWQAIAYSQPGFSLLFLNETLAQILISPLPPSAPSIQTARLPKQPSPDRFSSCTDAAPAPCTAVPANQPCPSSEKPMGL